MLFFVLNRLLVLTVTFKRLGVISEEMNGKMNIRKQKNRPHASKWGEFGRVIVPVFLIGAFVMS